MEDDMLDLPPTFHRKQVWWSGRRSLSQHSSSSNNRQIVSTGHRRKAESIHKAIHDPNGVACERVDHRPQELHVVVKMSAD